MQSWESIVRQFAPLVWRVCLRLLRNEADAADCFQETFLSAWKFGQRQTVSNWAGLLQRLATSRALDQLRRRKREGQRIAQHDLEELQADQVDPVQNAEKTELAERLRELLAELPPQQSEAYCLRHLSGLSYREIAEQMGITVNAVGVILHRVTERLSGKFPSAQVDRTK